MKETSAPHPNAVESEGPPTDLESQRAQIYALLSRLLACPMDSETLDLIRNLNSYENNTEIGSVLKALGSLAIRTHQKMAEEEYTKIFYGVGAGGELSPYASYYMTGLVYSKPLADLRKDMEIIGIAPEDGNKEPEDHIASLCEIMHGLIVGAYGDAKNLEEQHTFFSKHLAPWAPKFFMDLEAAKTATFYMPVGTIGKLFMSIEREGFEMVV